MSVAFVATAWGTRYGGINAFNMDLCRAVAAAVRGSMEVLCFAFGPTAEDVLAAEQSGVRLIGLVGDGDAGPVEAHRAYEIVHLAVQWRVDWWIGHDTVTGPLAIQAAKHSGSRAAVIQHTDYASYASLKGTAGTAIVARDVAETATLLDAQVIFAVGPKLAEAAASRVRRSTSGMHVIELVPGLATGEGPRTPPSTFRAVTFGRLDPQNDRLKQGRLAVRAFAQLIKDAPHVVGDDPRISVIGVRSNGVLDPEGEQAELSEFASKHAGRAVSVIGHPFTEDRDVLFHVLSDASVCLMLSLHEGFGLTGWEAIAAGVPLVLSRRSGLYALLRRVGDPALGCVRVVDVRGRPEPPYYRRADVRDTTSALLNVAHDPVRAKASAITLRSLLGMYTWERTAQTMLDTLYGEASSALSRPAPSPRSLLGLQPSSPKSDRREEVDTAILEAAKAMVSGLGQIELLTGSVLSADSHEQEKIRVQVAQLRLGVRAQYEALRLLASPETQQSGRLLLRHSFAMWSKATTGTDPRQHQYDEGPWHRYHRQLRAFSGAVRADLGLEIDNSLFEEPGD